MLRTKEQLEKLFEDSKKRTLLKKEKQKEKEKYLEYSSKSPNKGKKDTYYDKNRELITGKLNYQSKMKKIREELEIRWKTQSIKKL